MPVLSEQRLALLTAAFLHVPAKRLRALLRGEETALAEWVAGDSARKVTHARHRAREALQRLGKLHAQLITYMETGYPKGLLDLPDAPAFLTVRGVIPVGGLAIVGTRRPTEPAREFAFELARECKLAVVSGLARGVDAAAHRGALGAHSPTVAYVATGLGVTYPPEHKELEDAIVAGGGAIVSERLPGEPGTAWALVQRDRLQAAHASATVLVASEYDGGAMHTMGFAQQLKRPRFAVMGADFAFTGNASAVAAGAQALPSSASEALRVIARALR